MVSSANNILQVSRARAHDLHPTTHHIRAKANAYHFFAYSQRAGRKRRMVMRRREKRGKRWQLALGDLSRFAPFPLFSRFAPTEKFSICLPLKLAVAHWFLLSSSDRLQCNRTANSMKLSGQVLGFIRRRCHRPPSAPQPSSLVLGQRSALLPAGRPGHPSSGPPPARP